MPGNNLHSYSKILDASEPERKRPLQKCLRLQWENPYFLNITRSFVNQMEPIETNMI